MSRRRIRPERNWRRWQRVRRFVLDRDCWRCTRCGKAGRLEVHHVRPVSEGGVEFDPDNLTALCRRCHFDEHRPAEHPDVTAWRALVAQSGR